MKYLTNYFENRRNIFTFAVAKIGGMFLLAIQVQLEVVFWYCGSSSGWVEHDLAKVGVAEFQSVSLNRKGCLLFTGSCLLVKVPDYISKVRSDGGMVDTQDLNLVAVRLCGFKSRSVLKSL